MYFGSVKFFKHLILTVFFGWLGAATVLAVFFGIRCHMLTKQAESAQTENGTMKEYLDMMNDAGYSYDDIRTYINIVQGEEISEGMTADTIPVPGYDDTQPSEESTEDE